MTPEIIFNRLDDPEGLERDYRRTPEAFAEAFAVAWDTRPDSPVLGVWHARLDADGALSTAPIRASGDEDDAWVWAEILSPDRARALLAWTVGLVLVGGLCFKLPDLLGWPQWGDSRYSDFHQRFAPFYVVGPLLALLALRYRPARRVLAWAAGVAGGLLLVQALRPMASEPAVARDLAWLSSIHAPTLLLSLGAALALGRRWRESDSRMGYVQMVSESGALAALFLIGGVVLVGITAALFEAIGVNTSTVLFRWVVPFGLLGVLPVGALLAGQRPESARVAPLVARVFGPLALLVFAVYLPFLLASGELNDRDTLLSLNIALVGVLGIVLLMEAERPDGPTHWTDRVAAALVTLALVADLVAIAFVVGRLAEGGFTPNRLAVFGLNGLIAAHLAGLVVPLWRRVFGSGTAPSDAWTARFLTVYAGWSAFVILVFPLIF